jgi:hypothetical protein
LTLIKPIGHRTGASRPDRCRNIAITPKTPRGTEPEVFGVTPEHNNHSKGHKIGYMPKVQLPEIRCNQAGFAVSTADSSQPTASIEWCDVNAVLAYKRDLYAVDLICLGFVTANATIEVHEEMQGWSQLVEQLPLSLPGAPLLSGWWERVAKPPFASSVTKLFERA